MKSFHRDISLIDCRPWKLDLSSLTFLLIYMAGNYTLHVSLIGEVQTGIKHINYLEYK